MFEAYVKAFPNKRKQDCQREVTEIWNKLKKEDNLPAKVDSLLKSYAAIAQRNKGKLMSFWAGQAPKNEDAHPCKSVTKVTVEQEVVKYQTQTNKQDQNEIDLEAVPSSTSCEAKSVKYKTKAQDELQGQINIFTSDLNGLYKRKDSGILSLDQEKELKEKKVKVDELEEKQKRKKHDQESRRYSAKRRKKFYLKFVQRILISAVN